MNKFLIWIDNLFDKKVKTGTKLIAILLGLNMIYAPLKIQIIIAVLLSIIMILLIISAIMQRKKASAVIMVAATVVLSLLLVINRIFPHNDVVMLISLVGVIMCFGIMCAISIRDSLRSGDRERIRKVKIGMVGLVISLMLIIGSLLLAVLS